MPDELDKGTGLDTILTMQHRKRCLVDSRASNPNKGRETLCSENQETLLFQQEAAGTYPSHVLPQCHGKKQVQDSVITSRTLSIGLTRHHLPREHG